LDGEFVAVGGFFVAEACDASVEDTELDVEVGRVADAVREGGDAGVFGHVDGPDFNSWRGRTAIRFGAGRALEGVEERGFGRFALFDVTDCENETAEAERKELRGGVVAKTGVGARYDAGLSFEGDGGRGNEGRGDEDLAVEEAAVGVLEHHGDVDWSRWDGWVVQR